MDLVTPYCCKTLAKCVLHHIGPFTLVFDVLGGSWQYALKLVIVF